MFCYLTLEEYAVCELAYTPCLFALPTYLAQIAEKVHIFAIKGPQGTLEGIMPFAIRDKIAYNPPRATFGGWYGKDLPIEIAEAFWAWVMGILKQMQARALYIKLPPTYLGSTFPFRFLSSIKELNYHLPLFDDFVGKLHYSEKRRLRKSKQAGFLAEHYEKPNLTEVYEFIAKARKRKNYPLTLSLTDFSELFVKFPESYQVFVVRSPSSEIAALTVTVKITDKVLYNFYPADAELYLAYSPTVLLLEYVQVWARRQGFEIFDLGIATENGIRNEGLIRFKKNLGAIETPKYLFEYPLI